MNWFSACAGMTLIAVVVGQARSPSEAPGSQTRLTTSSHSKIVRLRSKVPRGAYSRCTEFSKPAATNKILDKRIRFYVKVVGGLSSPSYCIPGSARSLPSEVVNS